MKAAASLSHTTGTRVDSRLLFESFWRLVVYTDVGVTSLGLVVHFDNAFVCRVFASQRQIAVVAIFAAMTPEYIRFVLSRPTIAVDRCILC